MKVYIIKNNTCREIKLSSLKHLCGVPMVVKPTVRSLSYTQALKPIMPGDLSLYILFAGVTGIAYVVYTMYDRHQKDKEKKAIEVAKRLESELKEWELQKKIQKMMQEKNPQKISNTDCTNVFEEAEKVDCTHIF